MRRTFLIAVFAALMPIAAFAAPVFSISGGTGAFGAGSESGYMYTFNVAGGFKANDSLDSETIIVTADVGPGLKIDSVTIHLNGEYSGFPSQTSNVFANFMATGDISASDAVATPGFGGSLSPVGIAQQLWTLSGTDNSVGVQSISFNLKHALGAQGSEITTNTVKISLSVVPEPSSAMAIMALGLAGTAVRRRRV